MTETTTTSHALYSRVQAALESIRGYLQADGGDIRIHNITPENVLELQLLGACSSCSMSEMTMRAGVEQAVLRSVPEIRQVVTINA